MRASDVYSIIEPRGGGRPTIRFQKRAGMTWRDYLVILLHIAAEVEHGLMVQYLYAAYSLGGEDLQPEQARMVARWQKNILEVAKEEMGHLLTVQNLLALLGAAPNFTRAETPFEQALTPIPFALEPLTREVVASFTFAEMSPDIEVHLRASKTLRPGLKEFLNHHELIPITEETQEHAEELGLHKLVPQPVALLYEEVIRVISDEKKIRDSDFDEMSYEAQASWDDWGRGYAPNPKLLSPTGDLLVTPPGHGRGNVIVERAATRTEAIKALQAISGQGEAVHLQQTIPAPRRPDDEDGLEAELSHFERFLTIWQQYPRDWIPYRNVMRNPATRETVAPQQHMIKDKAILDWALLFNTRYRMLLTFLAHSYRLSRVVRPGEPNLRAMVMHRAFGEMYNLKTIAGLLVQMKVSKPGEPELFAGPPFETPFSLNMPAAHVDVFRLHRDLYRGAIEVNRRIQARGAPQGMAYLKTLLELDRAALDWIEVIFNAPARERA